MSIYQHLFILATAVVTTTMPPKTCDIRADLVFIVDRSLIYSSDANVVESLIMYFENAEEKLEKSDSAIRVINLNKYF